MGRTGKTHIKYPLLFAGLVLALLGWAQGVRGRHMDSTDRWAWSTNAGWINLDPTLGGVTVYPDHLEGYAWGENIGWIRLGTHTGGGAHTYGNTTAGDYGVNQDGTGNLSGYAWGTNVGWIKFDPSYGGVTIDPVTGDFDGYAWGENVGWIRFVKLGTIIVEKQTIPDGDPQSFEFSGDVAGSIQDGEQLNLENQPPGTYTSHETVPEGWDLTDITCDDGNSTGDVNTATATFKLEAGETVKCTFTNVQTRSRIYLPVITRNR